MIRTIRQSMILCFSCCAISLCVQVARAQDPTVPSQQILDRLQQPSDPVAAQRTILPAHEKAEPPPVIKLKAMVMRDPDNGIALIEFDGRRTRLRLSRSSPTKPHATASATTQGESSELTPVVGKEQSTAPEAKDEHPSGIVIHGTTYSVESFTPRSILLNSRGQKLLIQ